MRTLIVASYNKKRFAPFIVEQAIALEKQGCSIEWFGVTKKGVIGYIQEIPGLRKKIHDFKPDVIHAHYGLSCLLANMATRQVPVVSTYHGSDINKPSIRIFSKIAMLLSAWNIFVSQRNMILAGATKRKKCSLIPCGIDLPESWEELQNQLVEQRTLDHWTRNVLSIGKKHILFAGAFDNAVKNSQLAFDSIRELKVEEMERVELIELKGYNRNQVNALMYSCDAFLMTSKTEGSPQVIKEAMACGCPIVSVDVGDVAERINGLAGCYVAQSRDPKELAKLLKMALTFQGHTQGRERIITDGLTNEQVAKRIIKIYEQILNV